LVVVVVLLNDMDLPADLAGGKRCGMDIGVGGIRGLRRLRIFGQRDKLRADRSKRGVRSGRKEEAAQRGI
jgi:hypothetical protein